MLHWGCHHVKPVTNANSQVSLLYVLHLAVADPGFPVGGDADPLGGGANLRHIHFSAKTYAKTKEIDPVGGACAMVPPGSTNALYSALPFGINVILTVLTFLIFIGFQYIRWCQKLSRLIGGNLLSILVPSNVTLCQISIFYGCFKIWWKLDKKDKMVSSS